MDRSALLSALEAKHSKVRKQLRPTKIRVRNRNNEIHFEQLKAGGIVCVGTASQQYVKTQLELDAEEGITRLKPRHWSSENEKWVAFNGRAQSSATASPLLPRSSDNGLVVVTYNVWFSTRNQLPRCRALLGILKGCAADFICLQEVTPVFLKQLLSCQWVRRSFIVSDSTGSTLSDTGSICYGVVMMVRKASIDAIDAMFLLKLDSSMGRQCLVCDAQIKLCVPAVKEGEGSFPTKAVTVATVHLESLGFVSKRIAQLNRIFEVLDDPSRSTAHAVLVGDFNYDPDRLAPGMPVQISGEPFSKVSSSDRTLPGKVEAELPLHFFEVAYTDTQGEHRVDAFSQKQLRRPEESAIPSKWDDCTHSTLRLASPQEWPFPVGTDEHGPLLPTMPFCDHTGLPLRIDRILWRPPFMSLSLTQASTLPEDQMKPIAVHRLGTAYIDVSRFTKPADKATSTATYRPQLAGKTPRTENIISGALVQCAAAKVGMQVHMQSVLATLFMERPSDHFGIRAEFEF